SASSSAAAATAATTATSAAGWPAATASTATTRSAATTATATGRSTATAATARPATTARRARMRLRPVHLLTTAIGIPIDLLAAIDVAYGARPLLRSVDLAAARPVAAGPTGWPIADLPPAA